MNLTELERILGCVVTDKHILEQALTHKSFGADHYERLEFLGDRVLGMVVGDWLWRRFPDADEGELSRRHTALVRESTLVEIAGEWGVAGNVRLGAGEVIKDSILADVVEAILGAVWVSEGMAAVETLIKRDWMHYIDLKDEKDAKTRLQEWLQAKGMPLPDYVVAVETGPDHDKLFKVVVKTAEGEAEGEGRSKQVASGVAAANLMEKLESKE